MSDITKGLKNKFTEWKEAFDSKGLKIKLEKTKVMVSGGIIADVMSKSKVDPCKVCRLKAKANSTLCVQCGRWINS